MFETAKPGKGAIGPLKQCSLHGVSIARWYIFKPKIQIWVNFGRSCNGRCWYLYVHFV
jgi:hypothetical protein